MSFVPALPTGGLTGWTFLNRTIDAQKQLLAADSLIQRETSYFKEKFSQFQTAEDLVGDRLALTVAVGAFGLQDDIDNKYFLQRVLEDGTDADDALANLLADTRYSEFADAFGFGSSTSGFDKTADEIISAYIDQKFENAVGDQDEDLRLALNVEREITDIADSGASNDAKWFTIMGSPPLRKVFEVALNLPSSFGTLPIDDQLSTFKSRSSSVFGTPEVSFFSNTDKKEDLIRRFLLQSQLSEVQTLDSRSTALTLLQTTNTAF